MYTKIFWNTRRGKKGFTLVELVVVLVILAVMAAMLVPALTGWIKEARRKEYVNDAQYAITAAQATMVELYGLGPGAMANEANGALGGGSGGDVRWDTGLSGNSAENIAWGDRVLELMDRGRGDANDEPYILIFGVGKRDSGLTQSQELTVYYIAYVEDRNSPAVFYIDGEWIYQYPTDCGAIVKRNGTNYMQTDEGEIPLQFYVVSQRTGIRDNFWTNINDSRSLRSHCEPYFRG